PFNTMTRVGYIIDILDYSELATKSIIEILDLYPVIDEESFSIANHLLKTPKSLLASVYQSIVPNELLMHYSKRITLLKPDKIKEELKPLFNQANHYYPTKSEFKNNHQFKALEDKGIVSIETVIKPKVKEKKITYVLLGNTNHKTTIRQQKIVDFVGS